MKKLYKSNKDKVISGVLGGLGEYLDVDPTILRLVYLLIVIMTGLVPGLVVYIIASLIVPKSLDAENVIHMKAEEEKEEPAASAEATASQGKTEEIDF